MPRELVWIAILMISPIISINISHALYADCVSHLNERTVFRMCNMLMWINIQIETATASPRNRKEKKKQHLVLENKKITQSTLNFLRNLLKLNV